MRVCVRLRFVSICGSLRACVRACGHVFVCVCVLLSVCACVHACMSLVCMRKCVCGGV